MGSGRGGKDKGSSCSSRDEVMRVVLQLSLQAELLQRGHNELSLTASPAASHSTHLHFCSPIEAYREPDMETLSLHLNMLQV